MAPTEAECLDVALHLLDTGGPQAASIKRIAAALGAPAAAVYTYFPEQDAVFRALVDRLLGEVHAGVPVARRAPWQERVVALVLVGRERLTAHPGLIPLMLAGPPAGPCGRALAARLADLLGEAGLTGDDVGRGRRLIGAYALGAIALGTDEPEFGWGLDRVLAGLHPAN